MKKIIAILCVVGLLLTSSAAFAELKDFNIATTAENNKVIVDTDMGYLGDDAYCMFTLAQADAAGWVDLLGVTSDGGNVIAAYGTNAILKQLESIGRKDIPVYIGTDVPILGFRNLDLDKPITGGFQWTGAYNQLKNYVSPTEYHNLGTLLSDDWGYSTTEAKTDMNATEFMIQQVHKYPGKVTIFAIGACTNVALACMMDPTFAENTAGIIYMGGAIDVPGNANVCGEFNWFYDPEAVQVCLNNNFPYQIVVPHDIASKVLMAKDVFDMMATKNNTAITQLILDKQAPAYFETPTKTNYCWDPITAAVFLCPDLITETEFRDVAIDLNRTSYAYAKAASWPTGDGPYTSKNVQIVFNINRDAFWTFVTDLFGTQF